MRGGLAELQYPSRVSSGMFTDCFSDGVWPSRAISTSGLSETGMFFVRDPTDSELTVRQLYTFL